MANLVSPGYQHSALINSILPPNAERIIEFQGLNKRSVIAEGEMSDMWNLSTDAYPLLKPRKPRGVMEMPEGVLRPLHIIRRFDKIGLIAMNEVDPEDADPQLVSFYYDGAEIAEIDDLTTESTAVAINNKLCFFPQNTSIDITIEGVQVGTYRSLETEITLASDVSVTVNATDTRFTLSSGHNLNVGDAININGTMSYVVSGTTYARNVEISAAISDIVSTNTIVLPANTFIEIIGSSGTSPTLKTNTVISRTMPSLDYVVEWNNRLWGCSNSDNTIYASKLGDPSNWQYFQGTSLDSYYAQQGTDESFTGIAEYSGHLIFFKPNSLTRVYGTAPSNFQITNTKAFGCESGSSRSILTINDTIFYKSSVGIMAYQGGTPFCISEKLNMRMKNVVAGTEGFKYYASCMVKDDNLTHPELLVFDIAKGMWHREDDIRFTDTCKIGDKVYVASAEPGLTCDTDVFVQTAGTDDEIDVESDYVTGKVLIFNPDNIVMTHAEAVLIDPDDPPENYEDIEWRAVFGPFDEYIEEHKIYSKLAMRLKANGNASCDVFIALNEGEWEQVEHYDRVSTKGDFIPIIPRRCDRYSVKIEGKGNFEVKSLTRRVRKGTFGRL